MMVSGGEIGSLLSGLLALIGFLALGSIYFGLTGTATPSAAQNWVLDAQTAGFYGRVIEVSWGGQLTTTTAMMTRWTRPTTAGSGTRNALDATIQSAHPNAQTAKLQFLTFQTAPTLSAAPIGLYSTAWNAHGGIGRWLAAPGEEWMIVQGLVGSEVACINDTGTTASSATFGTAWQED